MTMTDHDRNAQDGAVDALFAAARAAPHRPSDDFLARLVAAAEAAQPAPVPPPARSAPPRRAWLAAIGGWPALGGLVATTVAGFWIGIAPPAGLSALTATVTGRTEAVGIPAEDDILALLEG